MSFGGARVGIRPHFARPRYYEFNFAPSTQWAAYRFDSTRCEAQGAVMLWIDWLRASQGDDAAKRVLSWAIGTSLTINLCF